MLVSLNTSGFGTETEATFDTEELDRLPQVVDTAETGSLFVTLGAGVGVLVPPDEPGGGSGRSSRTISGSWWSLRSRSVRSR